MRSSIALIALLVACSKSSTEQKAGSASPAGSNGSSGSSAAPAGSGSSAAEAPSEAAAVSGPTRSVAGVLEVSGAMTGKFEWIKKDQTRPISCAWSAEKEIGALSVDLSDGAGHLIKMTIDVPPTELGMPRLDVTSTDLPTPLKTKLGFNMTGDSNEQYQVKFDSTLAAEGADADAGKTHPKKGAKKDEKPSGPTLMLKGTLEVSCPPKK